LSAEVMPRSTIFSNRVDRPNVKTSSLGALSEFIGGIGPGALLTLPNDHGNGPFVPPLASEDASDSASLMMASLAAE
jgi:hypothetical protein